MFELWVKERIGQPTTKLLLTVAQSKGKRLTNNSLTKDIYYYTKRQVVTYFNPPLVGKKKKVLRDLARALEMEVNPND